MSRLNRFRAPQVDPETLKKFGIFVSDPTEFCFGSDTILTRNRRELTRIRRGKGREPCLSILSTSNRKNEKNNIFLFFRFEVLKIGKERGFPGEPGRIRREPHMCSDEQGRTSECIPRLSKNLGMHSRIERHGDRQTTGDWQFEEIWRLGRPITSNCQSPMLCLSQAGRGGLQTADREHAPRCREIPPK